MTLIVACKFKDGFILAGDTCASSYLSKTQLVTKLRYDEVVHTGLGIAGNIRDFNLLEFVALNSKVSYKYPYTDTGYKAVVTDVVPKVISALRAGKATIIKDGFETWASHALYVDEDGIYEIQDNFGVLHTPDIPYMAIGSGSLFAEGYLSAIPDFTTYDENQIVEVLTKLFCLAEQKSSGVNSTFTYHFIYDKKNK